MDKIAFLQDELWYGGVVAHGERYPLSATSDLKVDLNNDMTHNQVNPVFFSDKGRYIWLEQGGKVHFNHGEIEIEAESIDFQQVGTTLKEAATAVAMKHYPPTGTMPDKRAFSSPQYCSWVVLLWSQNQENILDYARSIVEKGFKPGLLIIDDTWQQDYGVWEFNRTNFPDPKAMMKELQDMGFLVSLWLCPYLSMDAPYRSPGIFEHMEADRVVLDENGHPQIVYWWEGYSAALDFRKSAAKEWINEQTKRLEKEYGVVGFKLDGGGVPYFDIKDTSGYSRNGHATDWIESIDNVFKESRMCFKLGGQPIIQRLNDKHHLWKTPENRPFSMGLSSLLPLIMTQGLAGYYYGCADMVGGGLSGDFVDKSNLDDELIIRWCEASALLPMIQFSYDVWNKDENRVAEICKNMLDLRERFLPYLLEKLEQASHTSVPAIRFMDYEFPNEGLGGIKDQFMLGEKYLVAPVLEKGATSRKVVFPKGTWKDIADGKIYDGGVHTVDAPIDKLPIFERSF